MCKSEIFAKIINIVSKETEVPVDQILSSDKNMQEMSKNMADLIAQNQKLMEQLGVVEASKNKK